MRHFLFVSMLSCVSACGGSPSAPVAPTPPSTISTASSLTVTGLRIFGPEVMATGFVEVFVARVVYSNGSTGAATPTWKTDNPNIATIDADGRVTARGPGSVTLAASSEGAIGSFSLRVRSASALTDGAHLAITYDPDPAPGSSTPCGLYEPTPSWTFSMAIAETRGIGFTVKVETFSLSNEDGVTLYSDTTLADEYFSPNAEFVEEVCTSLAGSRSGFISDILEGADDRGNQLTFAGRLHLLPAPDVSPLSGRIGPVPMTPGALLRVR